MGYLEMDSSCWPETNSIRLALPPGMDLENSLAPLKMFGEIASCKVGKDHSTALVVYYDVRAAAETLKAMGGGPFVQPGPQTGSRSVCLPGDADLTADDVAGISSLSQNADEGSYTVEFFDIREAARIRKKLASAEELEPAVVECTPTTQKGATCHNVMIHGLPNGLLSEMMMEAMLQQAGIDGVVSFSTKPGKPCGEARVTFYSQEAAQRCMAHFHGRQWDGCQVSTWLASDDATAATDRKRKDTTDSGCTESTVAPGSDEGEEEPEPEGE